MAIQPVKERPILFSAPMVQAILDGRKTQTRRLLKPQPSRTVVHAWSWAKTASKVFGFVTLDATERLAKHCPYGQPGDRLWVRETWVGNNKPGMVRWVAYRQPAPGCSPPFGDHPTRWKPSIHMPRWASRILLEVVSVRVERLKDISEPDARAEGIERNTKDGDLFKYGWESLPWTDWWTTAVGAFGGLWAGINGQESWDANPWVWVVEFKRVEA